MIPARMFYSAICALSFFSLDNIAEHIAEHQ